MASWASIWMSRSTLKAANYGVFSEIHMHGLPFNNIVDFLKELVVRDHMLGVGLQQSTMFPNETLGRLGYSNL